MISSITGQLRRVEPDRVHLSCGPILYEILVPASDIPELQSRSGEEIVFHTILDLEGDPTRGGLTPRLIGFLRPEDKRFFQLFITVKGIGPKRALRALVQPTAQIAAAIESKNTRFLVEFPEIGKRMAELIVAELAGKAGDFSSAPPPRRRTFPPVLPTSRTPSTARIALGISRPEAERLLDRARQVDPALSTTESFLREMLRLRTVRA